VSLRKHPEADSLYVEKVDIGDPGGPRTIVSGLVKYCCEEILQNRKVIVLCNLKPRKLKGIESYGMLLCASNEDHSQVEPIAPPEGCEIGQLMTFEGHLSAPIDPGNRASKAFDKVADDLYVNVRGEATYKGIPMMSPKGPCTSTLVGKIS
jgi:tRNA-binding EMAP/Myf-like protein